MVVVTKDSVHPGDAPGAAPTLPPTPRLGKSLRAALADLYFNSRRLVPLNLIWGVLLLAILAGVGVWSVGALAAVPLLALPQVAMARVAALIVREQSVSLANGLGAARRQFVPAIGLGAVISVAFVVLAFNLWAGITDGGLVAVALATLAGWGLAMLAVFSTAVWPLLVDPEREDRPVRDRIKLAGLLLVAHPRRMFTLAAVLVVFLALSTAAFAALLTVSVALATQVAARYVLPAADRLEARLAARAD